ncbi:hypothetical protein SAMN05660845_1906 [Flavobacterium swingsii]|uniref:Uncharacterized protein n=1 Tax=Flavobacterium swingsii TaxID=498292 RepID=A0A1I0YRE6_9FLAO|nr:hypothetical protein [Flavobacterium swingsii]SFB15792.1 hypothetical protein SAMN05660845_1906 [Flavobacterium swingsii]
MTRIILITFLFLCYNVKGQTKQDIKTYNFNYCYVRVTDASSNSFIKPWARDVEIIYDQFLKSIEILYTTNEFERVAKRLSFVSKQPNGMWYMKDSSNVNYYVLNQLENSLFMFMLAEKKQGVIFQFEMSNDLKE